MSCNKCRQAPRFETDTWCLACSAWEQLGIELVSAWHSPAVRALASESVVHTTRHVRALRNLASSLRSAGDSRAAGSSPAQKAERPGTAKKELPPPTSASTSEKGGGRLGRRRRVRDGGEWGAWGAVCGSQEWPSEAPCWAEGAAPFAWGIPWGTRERQKARAVQRQVP